MFGDGEQPANCIYHLWSYRGGHSHGLSSRRESATLERLYQVFSIINFGNGEQPAN